MRQGLSYFHETIFYGLPAFLRRIDTALKNIGQPMLPLNHCLFRFGSWCAIHFISKTALQNTKRCLNYLTECAGWAVIVMATPS